jgi:hypothetical protein
MPSCGFCGKGNFRTWKRYEEHHKNAHNVSMDSGVPRLDLNTDQARTYHPMDPADKQAEVTRGERAIREAAWIDGRLNPLVGCDKVSIEPEWDSERNIIQ